VLSSVLADGAVVGEGAVLEHVVLGAGARIPAGVSVRERSIEAGAIYDGSHDR
jgi:ADP-glucose pyrophosphorylase